MGKQDQAWSPGDVDTAWIEDVGSPVHPVLLAIEAAARPAGIPIVDRATGRVLGAIAAGRRRILEVGTAYGYSTLWMALGQPAGGRIVTIDPDAERTAIARGFWREAGVADERIEVVRSRALKALDDGDGRLAGPFDLLFIDALKPEYSRYLEAAIPRLAPGALVVADNVLWSGRTSGARPSQAGDASTEALRAFVRDTLADPRFSGTVLPVGDGLLLAGYRGGAR